MEITVITGACGGLGGAFVEALAAQGESMLLLGRELSRLQALKEEIDARYDLNTRVYALDLTDGKARREFAEYLSECGFRIRRLINVAGVDVQKPFEAYTQEKLEMQARVNFEGAVSLCHTALSMKAKTLEIINISSVSGIYPMPYFALYSASKRALWSFSVALREEVRAQGVRVTAVLPGAIPTRDDIKRQIDGQGLWGKIAAKSPQFVAKGSLKAAAKNKRTYIPGFFNRCMNFFTKLVPLSWKLKFIAKRWSKITKDAF